MVPRLLTFPDPVNDVAARAVASGVTIVAVTAVASRQLWLTIPLAYGFVARTLSGPRFSPLGLFATQVVAPRLVAHKKLLPGPPKRFAQAMGATFTVGALASWLGGQSLGAYVLLVMLSVPAFAEAAFGFCVGCGIFALLMRKGIIPTSVCEECADIYSPTADHRRTEFAHRG